MPRISNREKILTEGLRVVHERGFGGASIRDIVQAAGVPQGSFTNHFKSKDAFGLEIMDLYFAHGAGVVATTLRNESLGPLERLHAYFDVNRRSLSQDNLRNGCLLGNFSAEINCISPAIQSRLAAIFIEVERSFADCLRAAIAAGEVRQDLDADAVAGFIVASLQGAILLAKAQRTLLPVERFEQILFSRVLN